MTLYHYCCRHSADLIDRTMTLKPFAQPLLGGLPAVWATDMMPPDRDALGLTMHMVPCDRTKYVYTVVCEDEAKFEWWPSSPLRALVADIEAFEHEPLDPKRWWVSIAQVRCSR